MSPPFRLEVPDPSEVIQLRFWQWFSYSTYDTGSVQIQYWDNEQASWSDWETLHTNQSAGNDWRFLAIDLTGYAGQDIRLGFRHAAARSPSTVGSESAGWFIDDVRIASRPIGSAVDFSENFEDGWGNWASDNGIWQVGEPTTGPGECSGGQQCAGTLLSGSYYPQENSRLVYPTGLRLPQVSLRDDLLLRFNHWYTYGAFDSGVVQLSEYDETSGEWQAWTDISDPFTGSSGIWASTFVRLTDHAGKLVRIGFLHQANRSPSTSGSEAAGWFIDNIQILGLSNTPICRNDKATTTQNQSVTIDLLFNDTDPNGDVLRAEIATNPEHGTASIVDGAGLTYTPDLDYEGWDTFTYTCTDDRHGSNTAVVTVAVGPVAPPNRQPSISRQPRPLATPGQPWRFTPAADDPDGNVLTFQILNQPTWTSFDADTGTLEGTPSASDIGPYRDIEISVSDGELIAALPAFDVKVAEAPGIAIMGPIDNAVLNELIELRGSASGPDAAISLVQLSVTDGTNYLREHPQDRSLELSPGQQAWITPLRVDDDWGAWRFNLSTINWTPGKPYTLTARAIDELGQEATHSINVSFSETGRLLLSGLVLTEALDPLAGSEVVFEAADGTSIRTHSDSEGRFSQSLRIGWAGSVEVTHRGYRFAPASVDIETLEGNESFDFTAFEVPSDRNARAIIIAGGGDRRDSLWPATNSVSNLAYKVMRLRGLDPANIRYFNAQTDQDADDDGEVGDIYGAPTLADVEHAIRVWAKDYVNPQRPLILYLADHGLPQQFFVQKVDGVTEVLTAPTLATWLDELQTETGARVIVIYEACYSGSFMDDLKPPEGFSRIGVFSTGIDELAYFPARGETSFSTHFWLDILRGAPIRQAFLNARRIMQETTIRTIGSIGQNAVLDDNGDGIFHKDGNLAQITYIGDSSLPAPPFPIIVETSGDQQVPLAGAIPVFARVDLLPEQLGDVRAVLVPPDAGSTGVLPVTGLPELVLEYSAASGRYEGLLPLRQRGIHKLSFIARGAGDLGLRSVPTSVTIIVDNAPEGDMSEPDNSPASAGLRQVNGDSKNHDFHAESDQDWIRFTAQAGTQVEVSITSVGARADPILNLYDADGTTLIKTLNESAAGEDELLTWTPQRTGQYFLQVQNNSIYGGTDTGYTLRLNTPVGGTFASDLRLVQTLTNHTTAVGSNSTLRLSLSNVADLTSPAVRATATTLLPRGMRISGALPAGCALEEVLVTCAAPELDAGSEANWSFVISFELPGTHSLGSVASAYVGDELLVDANTTDNLHEITVRVAQASVSARLSNISTRGVVQGGDSVMIGGLIIEGADDKTVLFRGRGPSLADFNVQNVLGDPRLELYSGETLIDVNDDWLDHASAVEVPAAMAPSRTSEAVMIRTLSPGAYTAILRGAADSTGVGIIEAFELSSSETAQLVNISTRGFVGVGDDVLIGGLIVSGTEAQRVLIRARGPSLADFGVSDALTNPSVAVFDSAGTLLFSNDNWEDDENSDAIPVSLRPVYPSEAAVMTTLAPGGYTAIVRGANEATGVGIIEVFKVD